MHTYTYVHICKYLCVYAYTHTHTHAYIYIHIVGLKISLHPYKNTFIIFTNPSARAGYDTMSIFKRSITGLNSEFSCT